MYASNVTLVCVTGVPSAFARSTKSARLLKTKYENGTKITAGFRKGSTVISEYIGTKIVSGRQLLRKQNTFEQ